MSAPNLREIVPKTPGLYWVIPEAVGFAVRVYLHHYPRHSGDAAVELCASGRRLVVGEVIAARWEWFLEKPATDPADPEFIAAIARGHRMTGTRANWNSAAAALRDVVRRASEIECRCALLGFTPGLCLGCCARDGIAKALEAERESGPVLER